LNHEVITYAEEDPGEWYDESCELFDRTLLSARLLRNRRFI